MTLSPIVQLVFSLVRVVVFLVDLVTFPLYFALQKPWHVRRYGQGKHAECHEDEDGNVVYTSKIKPCEMNEMIDKEGLQTMTQVLNFICGRYESQEVLGTRSILSSELEQQSSGKMFIKQVLGSYSWLSYSDMRKSALALTKGFREDLKLESGSKLAILAETRADWMITAYACFLNNISMVTLYPTLGLDGLVSALSETEVSVIVVSVDTLVRVQSIVEQCSSLKFVVVMPALAPGDEATLTKVANELTNGVEVIRMNNLREKHSASEDSVSLTSPKASDCAIIMYTSGSTGVPKGVVLSHKNIVSALKAMINYVDFSASDSCMPLLPLAHVLELTAETTTMMFSMKAAYSSPFTVTDKSTKVKSGCAGDATLFRPTMMCAVPLLIERIYKSIVDKMRRGGPIVEAIFFGIANYKRWWLRRGFDTPIINAVVFSKIRANVGGRLRAMVTGGAALSEETHELIRAVLCIDLLQGTTITNEKANHILLTTITSTLH